MSVALGRPFAVAPSSLSEAHLAAPRARWGSNLKDRLPETPSTTPSTAASSPLAPQGWRKLHHPDHVSIGDAKQQEESKLASLLPSEGSAEFEDIIPVPAETYALVSAWLAGVGPSSAPQFPSFVLDVDTPTTPSFQMPAACFGICKQQIPDLSGVLGLAPPHVLPERIGSPRSWPASLRTTGTVVPNGAVLAEASLLRRGSSSQRARALALELARPEVDVSSVSRAACRVDLAAGESAAMNALATASRADSRSQVMRAALCRQAARIGVIQDIDMLVNDAMELYRWCDNAKTSRVPLLVSGQAVEAAVHLLQKTAPHFVGHASTALFGPEGCLDIEVFQTLDPVALEFQLNQRSGSRKTIIQMPSLSTASPAMVARTTHLHCPSTDSCAKDLLPKDFVSKILQKCIEGAAEVACGPATKNDSEAALTRKLRSSNGSHLVFVDDLSLPMRGDMASAEDILGTHKVLGLFGTSSSKFSLRAELPAAQEVSLLSKAKAQVAKRQVALNSAALLAVVGARQERRCYLPQVHRLPEHPPCRVADHCTALDACAAWTARVAAERRALFQPFLRVTPSQRWWSACQHSKMLQACMENACLPVVAQLHSGLDLSSPSDAASHEMSRVSLLSASSATSDLDIVVDPDSSDAARIMSSLQSVLFYRVESAEPL